MDIAYIKRVMKEKGITQLQLSALSNIPIQTLRKIFAGYTPNPRIDTVHAIEKALGLDKEPLTNISSEDMELVELIKQLDEEQTKELSNFVDYLLSKRK